MCKWKCRLIYQYDINNATDFYWQEWSNKSISGLIESLSPVIIIWAIFHWHRYLANKQLPIHVFPVLVENIVPHWIMDVNKNSWSNMSQFRKTSFYRLVDTTSAFNMHREVTLYLLPITACTTTYLSNLSAKTIEPTLIGFLSGLCNHMKYMRGRTPSWRWETPLRKLA